MQFKAALLLLLGFLLFAQAGRHYALQEEENTLEYDSLYPITHGEDYPTAPGIPKEKRPSFHLAMLSNTEVTTEFQKWPLDGKDPEYLVFPKTFKNVHIGFNSSAQCERDEEAHYYFKFRSACDGKPVRFRLSYDPLPDSHHDCALVDVRFYLTIIEAPEEPGCFSIRTTFGWDYGYHAAINKVGQVLSMGFMPEDRHCAGIDIIGEDTFNYPGDEQALVDAKPLTGPFNISMVTNTIFWTQQRGYMDEVTPKGWNWPNGPVTFTTQSIVLPEVPNCNLRGTAILYMESRCREPITDRETYNHFKIEWLPLMNDKCQVIQNRFRATLIEKSNCLIMRTTAGWSFGGWKEINGYGQYIDFGQDEDGQIGHIEVIGMLGEHLKQGMDY